MRPSRDPALVALTAAFIFAGGSFAQNDEPEDPPNPPNNQEDDEPAPNPRPTSGRPAGTSREQPQQPSPTRPAQPSNSADDEDEDEEDTDTRSGPPSPTGPATAAPTVQVTGAPEILTSRSVFHLTDLPTIAGAGIPTMIVPNTAGAPYMQKSTLPEGSVFIAVGSILALFGAAVLAWRALVAWSLHRSVKRSAMNQSYVGDSKHSLRGPGYSQVGAVSSASLDRLSQHITKTPKHHSTSLPPMPKGPTPSGSSLFFSPTAGAGTHTSASRSSTFLPAGYYAAGTASPAMGSQTTHLGAPPGPLSHGPAASGYMRTRSDGTSPPRSPPHSGSGGGPYDRPSASRGNESAYGRSSVAGGHTGAWGHSSSSLNLSSAPQGRAPSAYLEDLFENHGNGPRERY